MSIEDFKTGDRVRWTGAYDKTVVDDFDAAFGQTGTVTEVPYEYGGDSVGVEWDISDNERNSIGLSLGIYSGNLEKIEMLDTTKPLILGSNTEVNFITETSDGNILIDVPLGALFTSGWYIFNKQGKLVRSHNNTQASMKLKNKVEDVVTYQLIVSATTPFIRSASFATKPSTAGGQFVKLTSRDGKVVNVKLVQ